MPPFCLHALNTLYLESYGWYRVDPRGNKEGVDAEFKPPEEQLAFSTDFPGEVELPEIWAEPLPIIVECLEKYKSYIDVANHLPDTEVVG